MATPFITQSLMTEIKDRIQTAWGISSTQVYYGTQKTTSANIGVPVANIIFGGATMVFSRNNSIRYNYAFEIIGRFSYPASDSDLIEFEKNDRLNELYNAMITGVNFAGLGDLHNITAVSHEDLADDSDNLFTVTASFEVQSEQPRL